MRRRLLMLVAVAALFLPAASTAGGTTHGVRYVLRAVDAGGKPAARAQLEQAAAVIRQRLARLGAHASVQTGARGSLVIRLDGATPSQTRPLELATAQADLAFYDLEVSVVPPTRTAPGVLTAKQSLAGLLAPVQGRPAGAYYVLRGSKAVAGPLATRAAAARASHRGERILSQPAGTSVVSCSAATAQICPGLASYPRPGKTLWYLFTDRPQMSGAMLDRRLIRATTDPSTDQPVVLIGFTADGNRAFKRITKAEAVRGRFLQQPQHFAIVLDGQIRTWPQIDYTQLPNGVDPSGAGVQIVGLPSLRAAKDVALVLETGALPVRFELVSRMTY